MKNLKKLILLSIISISLISCSNEEGDTKKTNTVQNDVYVCGHENNYPTFWKNGIPNQLENNGKTGDILSIKINDNDVFCLGFLTNSTIGGDLTYHIWKNNTIIAVLDPSFLAEDFAIDGNDIYIIGQVYNPQFGHYQGKLWKNGVLSNLTSSGKESFTSITIANHNVYVTGYYYVGNNSYAAYWKNNTLTTLSNGVTECNVSSIEVFENNVYVTGAEKNSNNVWVAKYWKNGNPTSLTNGNYGATAGAIRLINNDLYVNGAEYNSTGDPVLKYWKNGTETALTNGNYFEPQIKSMEIIDNNVITIGYSDENLSIATLFSYNGISLLTKPNCEFRDLCMD